MQTGTDYFDVVIIGFGPTGATLALLLSQCNVRTLILDKEADIYPLPRAVHFDDEIMRIFQNIQIAEKLESYLHINPGMRFVDRDGNLLLDWPRPQRTTEQGWNASYRFHQPDLEHLLRKKISESPLIRVQTGCHVTNIEQSEDYVRITYFDKVKRLKIHAFSEYVVGCDGSNSFAREKLCTQTEDFGFAQRWLVIDAILKKNMPALGDYTLQYCDPERPVTYCRNPGLRRRWEIAVGEQSYCGDNIDRSLLWQTLSPWITPQDASIERTALYTFRSVVAKSWQNGRIIIAGDAAHLMPPFMGQGMCAGIRDAANLGWKLAHCIKNGYNKMLLESYEQERSPHVREYIMTAVSLGELICSKTPMEDLKSLNNNNSPNGIMQSLNPILGRSKIFKNIEKRELGSGALFGQPIFSNGKKMDDVYPYQAVLVSSGSKDTDTFPIITSANAPAADQMLSRLNAHSVLIRPDRYIFAVAKNEKETVAIAGNNSIQRWFI